LPGSWRASARATARTRTRRTATTRGEGFVRSTGQVQPQRKKANQLGSPKQSSVQQHDEQILQAITQELQQVSDLFLGGTAYTPASLASLIQSRIDAAGLVGSAKAGWLSAVQAYAVTNRQVSSVVRDLRLWLLAAYGPGSAEMAAFGFTSKSKPAAGKAAAKKKAKKAGGRRAKKAPVAS
jgi:hypothetical protein